MTGPVKIQRDARGKRPRFYADPAIAAEGVDHVMSMVMVLAQELCVVRDRLDTVERICAAKGVMLDAEIEAFHADQATLEAREKRRQDLLGRLYYLARKDAAEQASKDTAERYEKALEDIAAG